MKTSSIHILVLLFFGGMLGLGDLNETIANSQESNKAPKIIPDVKELQGPVLFHGRYKHRSGGRDIVEPSELWINQSTNGAVTALTHVPFQRTSEFVTGNSENRIAEHRTGSMTMANQSGYQVNLEFSDGKAMLTRRGLRQDCYNKELSVPSGAGFDPNTRPDSYLAANVFLRAVPLKRGAVKEFRVFDWDNSGEGLVDYTIRIENAGKETVEVPAGSFEAYRLVLRQTTTADTWFKKRAGHATDFWVLENYIIVKILRHREPYEVALLDYTVPAKFEGAQAQTPKPGKVELDSGEEYTTTFLDLYNHLGRYYPCFEMKGIDWKKTGSELLPRSKSVKSDSEFGLLCLELVARLEDSHSYLMAGKAKVPEPPVPRWDPGFTCLIDDRDKLVIYYVDKGGPADKAGVQIGMAVQSINGKPADQILKQIMEHSSKYSGYSSQRYLRYHAAQWLGRQMVKGAEVVLVTESLDDKKNSYMLPATLGVRYLPRLPVTIPGIRDSGDVSWTRLSNNIGYIYVRRITEPLIPKLDEAVEALKDSRGLIIDVRGNSGGGFDGLRAMRNFSLNDAEEPNRPRFKGPIALLIDSRCISAGEGWASWFVANKRARLYGETTAGASSAKETYTLKNGLFIVNFSSRPRFGFLDRPIEYQGIVPDVPVRQNAADLAAGRDTVLEKAKAFLLE